MAIKFKLPPAAGRWAPSERAWVWAEARGVGNDSFYPPNPILNGAFLQGQAVAQVHTARAGSGVMAGKGTPLRPSVLSPLLQLKPVLGQLPLWFCSNSL